MDYTHNGIYKGVDWSKAPEDTTHAGSMPRGHADQVWYKYNEFNGSWAFRRSGSINHNCWEPMRGTPSYIPLIPIQELEFPEVGTSVFLNSNIGVVIAHGNTGEPIIVVDFTGSGGSLRAFNLIESQELKVATKEDQIIVMAKNILEDCKNYWSVDVGEVELLTDQILDYFNRKGE